MKPLISFLKTDLNIPPKLIPIIVEFFQEEELAKDDFLVKKGAYCRRMCLIQEGYLRFYSYSERKVITHWIFGKGQLVTDIASFSLQQPAKWNIQALADTQILSLNYTNYQRLRIKVPEWDKYEKLLLVKLMSALENRVYALLSMSAEERYQYLYQSNSNMFNELPLQYLASILGMTPETLSRIRGKFNS